MMASLQDRLHAAQAELQDLRLRTMVERDRLAADLARAHEQIRDLSKQLVQIGMIREAETEAHHAEMAELQVELAKAKRPWWRWWRKR
jgi:hypothetical protein